MYEFPVPGLYRQLGRLCIYFFILILLAVVLYLLGNFQEFLDSSQFFLLKTSQILSILFLITDIYYMGVLVFFTFRYRRFPVFRFFLTLGGGILVALYLFSSQFLASWLVG